MKDKDKKADNAEMQSVEKNLDTNKKDAKDKKTEKLDDKAKKAEKKADNTSVSSEKYKYLIKNRQVRKHTRRHKFVVILMIFLAVTILLGGSVYGMLTFLEYNNFKVLVDKEGMNILSLSNSEDFSNPSEVISIGGPKYMDNTTLLDISYLLPEIEATEGSFGEGMFVNYIAATFYLKNVSGKDQIFRESILLKEVTKGMDDAIRIMIIRDGQKTVYAKPNKDGQPEEVVPGQMYGRDGSFVTTEEDIWMAEPFASETYVCYNTGVELAAGQVIKYSLLIWLEGWDEECINDILGGTIKLEMQFTRTS